MNKEIILEIIEKSDGSLGQDYNLILQYVEVIEAKKVRDQIKQLKNNYER